MDVDEAIATMFQATLEEHLRAISFLLSGDALVCYECHIKQCTTYKGAIDVPQE